MHIKISWNFEKKSNLERDRNTLKIYSPYNKIFSQKTNLTEHIAAAVHEGKKRTDLNVTLVTTVLLIKAI